MATTRSGIRTRTGKRGGWRCKRQETERGEGVEAAPISPGPATVEVRAMAPLPSLSQATGDGPALPHRKGRARQGLLLHCLYSTSTRPVQYTVAVVHGAFSHVPLRWLRFPASGRAPLPDCHHLCSYVPLGSGPRAFGRTLTTCGRRLVSAGPTAR